MLSNWADGGLNYFAKHTGIPIAEYSSMVVGEGLGVVAEQATDITTKGWLNKGLKIGTGILAGLYVMYGKPKDARLKREFAAFSHHLMFRIAELRPADITELMTSIGLSGAAVKRGDLNGFMASVLRSPTEMQALFTAGGSAVPRGTTGGTPRPRTNIASTSGGVPAKFIDVEAPPAAGQGRYQTTT